MDLILSKTARMAKNNSKNLEFYIPNDFDVSFEIGLSKDRFILISFGKGCVLKEVSTYCSEKEMPPYCIDLFWQAGISREEEPWKKMTKYSVSFEKFFMEVFDSINKSKLEVSQFEIKCLFRPSKNPQAKSFVSQDLNELIALWLKSNAKEKLYIDPEEEKLCSVDRVNDYLGVILDHSSQIKFENFYDKVVLGIFEVYVPNKEMINKVRDFLSFRKSVRELDLCIDIYPDKPDKVERAFYQLVNLLGFGCRTINECATQ